MNLNSSSDEEKIESWINRHMAASVTRIERLSRWRPAWEVDVDLSGVPLKLHVRGDRDAGLETTPLRREHDVLVELGRQMIPVPHVYGWCDDPPAIVMENVSGTAYEGGGDTDPVKRRSVEHYVEILAAMHRLDVAPFVAAGLTMPRNDEDVALSYFNGADRVYRETKSRPEPLIEFVRKWILNNVPRGRSRAVLLSGDAPQFVRNGDRVAAIIDLEMAIIGDPMADLASMRLRDTIEPTGNLGELYAHYEAAIGIPLDRTAIDFHTVVNFIAVAMMTRESLRSKRPHPALIEFHSHYLSATRCSIAAIAGMRGIELPDVAAVLPEETSQSELLTDLVAQCGLLPAAAGFYRQHPILSLALYAQRVATIGPQIAALERRELTAILGTTPADELAADAALEKFVLGGGAEHDDALIRYFYRREMRRFQLISAYPSPIIHRALAAIEGV
jgi:aminoglycoside phosphotransferase (APT) family kinase protein